jgi:hypothetical protein
MNNKFVKGFTQFVNENLGEDQADKEINSFGEDLFNGRKLFNKIYNEGTLSKLAAGAALATGIGIGNNAISQTKNPVQITHKAAKPAPVPDSVLYPGLDAETIAMKKAGYDDATIAYLMKSKNGEDLNSPILRRDNRTFKQILMTTFDVALKKMDSTTPTIKKTYLPITKAEVGVPVSPGEDPYIDSNQRVVYSISFGEIQLNNINYLTYKDGDDRISYDLVHYIGGNEKITIFPSRGDDKGLYYEPSSANFGGNMHGMEHKFKIDNDLKVKIDKINDYIRSKIPAKEYKAYIPK